MYVSETWLSRWYISAIVLTIIGIALAIFDPEFGSMSGMTFRFVFGGITGALVVGFNLLMLVVCWQREQGWRKGIWSILFLLLPLLFGFLYYWRIPSPRRL